MLMVDGRGTPIGLHIESASPSEVKLLEATLDSLDIPGKKAQPERLIADKGYDSNKARQLIESRGMLPIIPARKNNTKATHQDGRHLKRYRNRWIIERTNAWLQNFRRLVVRYERSHIIFEGLIHMAFAMMILKRFISS
jgi:transposase